MSPDYYGEFELVFPKGYKVNKETGLEIPVLMWINGYCDFETLLENCKEYENDINESLKQKTVKKNLENKER